MKSGGGGGGGVAEASSASGLKSTFTPSQIIWKLPTRVLAPADPRSSPLVKGNGERQAWSEARIFISFPLPGQGAGAGPGVDPSSSWPIPKSRDWPVPPLAAEACTESHRRPHTNNFTRPCSPLEPSPDPGLPLYLPPLPAATPPHPPPALHWVFWSSLRRTSWLRMNAVSTLLPTVSRKRPEKLWGQRVCRGS